jgi:Mn2+/Fe2+ NRAMP family transporter
VAGRDEPVKKYLGVALGVLTAIGGFVDIGDLVTNAQVGARFGLSLAWATVLGVAGICVFAEMSGRVAAVSGRPTFDLVRERIGPRFGMLNLISSMLITLLTFAAEIGGVALAIQLVVSVHELLIVPLVALLVWLVLWRAKFSLIENAFGLLGLALVVFAVAAWQLGPDWPALAHQATHLDKPHDEFWSTYAYYAVALFGAAMTPYEVFFFSSGGVEEGWIPQDLGGDARQRPDRVPIGRGPLDRHCHHRLGGPRSAEHQRRHPGPGRASRGRRPGQDRPGGRHRRFRRRNLRRRV